MLITPLNTGGAMSTSSFYSDRVAGPVPRIHESLPDMTAQGLKNLITRRIEGNWLAQEFPLNCPDDKGIWSTNEYTIGPDLSALVPGVAWPLWQDSVSDETLFDVLEYFGQRLSKPSNGTWHSYFGHHELNFDQKAGRAEFRAEVNQLLSRGGTVFEMSLQMQIQRVGSLEVQEALRQLRPDTGDPRLDDIIEAARHNYLSREPAIRETAIEKFWDAFERLKTIDDPTDKKKSIQALLGYVSDTATREVVETEMNALTRLGNEFQIRHHEMSKHPIPATARDYFAARMVNLLTFLLQESHRLAST
jgi:hypothetical protein